MADEVALLWHGNYEPHLVGVFATKHAAYQRAIALNRREWVEAFDWSRLLGKRERFVDGTKGEWWDDAPRNYRTRIYYVRTSAVLHE